jgi:DNA repair photolyase
MYYPKRLIVHRQVIKKIHVQNIINRLKKEDTKILFYDGPQVPSEIISRLHLTNNRLRKQNLLFLGTKTKGVISKRLIWNNVGEKKTLEEFSCYGQLDMKTMSIGACPHSCFYCKDRSRREKINLIMANVTFFDKIDIDKHLQRCSGLSKDKKFIFSLSNSLDALAYNHLTGICTEAVKYFAKRKKHYLLITTKNDNVDELLAVNPKGRTIVSFTLTEKKVSKLIEPGAPSFEHRIIAAQKCQKAGYRIKLRFHPIFKFYNWKKSYKKNIEKALSLVQPEEIILGSAYVMQSDFDYMKKKIGKYRSIKSALKEMKLNPVEKQYRYPRKIAYEILSYFVKTIHSIRPRIKISLCVEPPQIWRDIKRNILPDLGGARDKLYCNSCTKIIQ